MLLRAVIYLVDLVGKLSKVGDDELFLKGLCQQHDVVAHTPTRGHVMSREELQRTLNTDAAVSITVNGLEIN